VTRLRNLPAWNRVEEAQHALGAPLFFGRSLQQGLRRARFVVTFSEAWIFKMETAVVVECRTPEHGAVGHHAASNILGFEVRTGAAAASFSGDTQVTRIDEADVRPTFTSKKCIRSFGIGSGGAPVAQPFIGKARLDVRLALDAFDFFRVFTGFTG